MLQWYLNGHNWDVSQQRTYSRFIRLRKEVWLERSIKCIDIEEVYGCECCDLIGKSDAISFGYCRQDIDDAVRS